jgi:hypothetical protein
MGVNQNDFEELVGGILTNPVRVEDTEVSAASTNTLFGNVLVGLFLLELTDTHTGWLTENDTFTDVSFTTTTSDTATVNNEALFLLIT